MATLATLLARRQLMNKTLDKADLISLLVEILSDMHDEDLSVIFNMISERQATYEEVHGEWILD